MADTSILIPGSQNDQSSEQIQPITDYLRAANRLSEFDDELSKQQARYNLDAVGNEELDTLLNDYYTKAETQSQISSTVAVELAKNTAALRAQLTAILNDYVKTDGSTPFIARQKGQIPTEDNDLATKKYVDGQITSLNQKDTALEQSLVDIDNKFNQYMKLSDTYLKSQLYTKAEINSNLKNYVKSDGSVPFTKPQLGVDPTTSSHLVTKRYADNLLEVHLLEPDPHNFISILDSRLSSYAKKDDTYTKSQTYSRSQVDSVVNNLVNSSIDSNIHDYIDPINNTLDTIERSNYVKADGTVAFEAPISGIDAISEDQLVTYRQLLNATDTSEANLVWHTSGPIESTVGHMEDNSEVPETMTFQEVCDSIFYGKTISITHPDYVTIGNTLPVTLCIHGSLALLNYAELYQNGEVIEVLEKDNFEDGCVTIDSLPISEDTEFIFKVYYTNDATHQVSSTVKCYLPVFVGLLPKWKPGATITMDYLKELEIEDVNGTQNRFLKYGDNLTTITFKYQFEDPELRQPFVVVPQTYPALYSMTTQTQSFGIDAFEVIDQIPLQVEGIENGVIFTIYIYRQALSSLNQEITFNFNKE